MRTNTARANFTTGIFRITFSFFVLFLAATAIVAQAEHDVARQEIASSQKQPIDLTGSWNTYYLGNEAEPGTARIIQNGTSLSLDEGSGSTSTGIFSDKKIEAEGWNVTGTVSADGNRIYWSDKNFWVRKGEHSTRDFSGVWSAYGADGITPYGSGTITANGDGGYIIDNDQGSISSGRLSGAMMVASEWAVNGTISDDGNKIVWSNNSLWLRQGSSPNPAPNGPPAFDLTGSWIGLNENGRSYDEPAKITQNGSSLTADNGQGGTVAGTISGKIVSAPGWSVTGTVSEDGTRITWSNRTTWIRRIPM